MAYDSAEIFCGIQSPVGNCLSVTIRNKSTRMAEIKRNRRGLSLRFLVLIRRMYPIQDDFWESKTLAIYVAKVVCYIYR